MISLQNITKTYAMGEVAVHALRGVSLTIEPGEFVAIMGPSGSGKSTLLHILGLLDVPDEGSYRLLGHEVAHLSDNNLAALRNSTIGFVFQHFNLLARTSAAENAVLPMIYSPDGKRKNMDKARKLLTEIGLGDRLEHHPNELSGGQQQRVAIARALIHDPRIIMADEPTGNLDSASADEIIEILNDLNRRGITVVMVTHESDVAAHARRTIRMRDGVIQSDTLNGALSATGAVKPGAPAPAGARPTVTQSDPVIAARSGYLLSEIPHDFKQAWRALMANKVRTALSMLGIMIGVTAVIAMLAIGTGARQSIEAQLASMGSNLLILRSGARHTGGVALEAGAVTRFTPQDIIDIRAAVPSIKRIGGIVNGRGQAVYGNKNWNTRIGGVEPVYAQMRASEPTAGRFFTDDEVNKRARVAVLGQTLVRELFGDANPLGEYIKINKVNFLVIGILPEKGATSWNDQDNMILIPLTTAMYRLLGKDYLDTVDIEIVLAEAIPSAQEDIKALITRTHRLPPSQTGSFEIRNMAEMQAMLTETSRTMAFLLASIAAVSLLVGGIGIMNIMLVSVTERTREIGIRKAVGARRRDILAQFLTEALVVSITGGAIGILLGWLISMLVSALAGWPVAVTASSIILAVGFSAVIGIIFGLWPAQKASRLNPIEALRYE
ncbi:MAG: ABC transporter permease [Verrucomicrobia bacterium]|nr:ABC transporter permease [Verrucomicrobiota bacterium]MBU4247193.1 ABC transporter permease [Verrucomicrobiota bacterium]MBU4291364.1 ABC transporter permease [Verrucomicrobiota bacterium]MBU4497688.1 ABC transporter permease [Verrucomicrobiota bacterium]MCG2680672.1 ABC transporter permease [Kiritimatiellia bacterium]